MRRRKAAIAALRRACGWTGPFRARPSLIATSAAILSALFASGAAGQVRYVERDWQFDDVEVATVVKWLRRARVSIPVELDGQVSGSLSIGVPWNSLGDAQAWRFGGTLRSDSLEVENVDLKNVRLTLKYRDGVLRLSEFRIALPGEGESSAAEAGTLSGQAAMELAPLGEFTASAEVAALQLATAGQWLGVDLIDAGEFSGIVEAAVPVDKLTDVEAWAATAEASMADLSAADAPSVDARSSFVLEDGKLAARNVSLSFAGATLTGNAVMTLSGDLPWTSNLIVETDQLQQLAQALFEASDGNEAIAQLDALLRGGRLRFNGTIDGKLAPVSVTAKGRLTMSDLVVVPPEELAAGVTLRPLTLEQLDAQIATDENAVRVSQLDIRLLGGRVTAQGQYPLGVGEVTGTVEWSEVRLADVAGPPVRGPGASRGTLKLTVPNDEFANIAAWDLAAVAEISSFGYGELAVDSAEWEASLQQGSLQVARLAVNLLGGRVEAAATIPFTKDEPSNATIRWDRVETAAAAVLLTDLPISVGGATSGDFQLNVPSGAWAEIPQWKGSGQFSIDRAAIYDFDLRNVSATDVTLAEGRLTLPSISATLDGQSVAADAVVTLAEPITIRANVQCAGFQARRLAALPYLDMLPGKFSGRASADVRLTIVPAPLAVSVVGQAAVDGVDLFGASAANLRAEFDLAPEQLQVRSFQAELSGGAISGRAAIPFEDQLSGSAQVTWGEIDAGQLAMQMLAVDLPLAGTTNGTIDLTIPPGALTTPFAWEAEAQASIEELRLGQVRVASVEAALEQTNRQLAYSVEGQFLGGALELQGERTADAPADGLRALGNIEFSLRQADLSAASRLAGGPSDVAGSLTATARFSANADDWNWDANVETTSLAVGGRSISPSLRVRATGNAQQARLLEANGSLAGGELSGGGTWTWRQGGSRSLRLRLRSAEIEELKLLAPDGEDIPASGRVTVDLRIYPGATWRIVAIANMLRGELAGVTVRNLRVPVNASWSPQSGALRASASRISLAAAQGRMTGRLTARYQRRLSFAGRFEFSRFDVGKLLGGSTVAQGKLTGTLDLSARNMRSINDVQATLVADLNDARTSGVSLFQQIGRFVPGLALAGGMTFDQGRIEARLSRGTVNVERLALASRAVQLFITGRVALSGRLRLDAVVSTFKGGSGGSAQTLLTRLLAVPATPAAVLVQANHFLSNRVIHLAIAGTVDRPIVRLRPFQTLREEAVRFFLTAATGAAGAGGSVGLSR